jgi:quercetin dioxygenase-like cupin family protein
MNPDVPGILFFEQSAADAPRVSVPVIGVEVTERLPPTATGGRFSIIETVNQPGFGPPLHRHHEAEIFRVLEGTYLYRAGEQTLHATVGDVVSIPGGMPHTFRNITDKPARQLVLIVPGWDSVAMFTEFAGMFVDGVLDPARRDAWCKHWRCDLLGPPLGPEG